MDKIKKTHDEMKKLGKEVTDLKQSLENALEEKVKKLDQKHVNLKNQCNDLYNDSLEPEYFNNKLNDQVQKKQLEDRWNGRRAK